jgi:hypothetical protein
MFSIIFVLFDDDVITDTQQKQRATSGRVGIFDFFFHILQFERFLEIKTTKKTPETAFCI